MSSARPFAGMAMSLVSGRATMRGESRRAVATTSAQVTPFVFVDRIRFLAIALITFGHSDLLGTRLDGATLTFTYGLYSLTKFDIICMYLVSGFLMGDAVDRSHAYLLRRIRKTVLPWLFWLTLLIVASTVKYIGEPEYWQLTVSMAKAVFLYSSYWFIPNYILSLFVMFFVARRVSPRILGPVLGVCSLVYGANLYGQWFTTQHTVAWFGFMVYLWLGIQLRRRWPTISKLLQRVRWFHVLPVILLAGLTVMAETAGLFSRGSMDGANALKFSNHLYSVSWFVLLVIIRSRFVPSFINSSKESFGVYLVHPLVIVVANKAIKISGLTTADQPQSVQLAAWLAMGALIYLGSLLVVKGLTRLGYGRLVGAG